MEITPTDEEEYDIFGDMEEQNKETELVKKKLENIIEKGKYIKITLRGLKFEVF